MITGNYQIDILHEGTMRVDGGITFSGLPKAEWEKFAPPDAHNRIQIGLNQLLIRGNGIVMLIDTGIGNKLRPRTKQLMGMESALPIKDRLMAMGIKPDEVTHIVLSHLHYDHCGGATETIGDSIEPVFTKARYYIQKNEWKAACNPDEISRSSYCPHDFLPLHQTGNIKFLTGDCEIVDGIFLEVTGGHTAAHQIIKIEDGNSRILYPADICPTPFHLLPERREAFDLFPCDTLIARRTFLRRIKLPNTLVAFSHSCNGTFYGFDKQQQTFVPVDSR